MNLSSVVKSNHHGEHHDDYSQSDQNGTQFFRHRAGSELRTRILLPFAVTGSLKYDVPRAFLCRRVAYRRQFCSVASSSVRNQPRRSARRSGHRRRISQARLQFGRSAGRSGDFLRVTRKHPIRVAPRDVQCPRCNGHSRPHHGFGAAPVELEGSVDGAAGCAHMRQKEQ